VTNTIDETHLNEVVNEYAAKAVKLVEQFNAGTLKPLELLSQNYLLIAQCEVVLFPTDA
jgi:hypothetical protein